MRLPLAAAAAVVPAAKGSGALVGVGVGVLLLGALGFGGWRMMTSTGSAVEPASAGASAPAPSTVAAAIAPVPAPAAPPFRFDPAREFDRIVQAQSAGFVVRAEPVKAELRISKADEFKFRVTAERDGFLYVLGHSPDGSLALLVPNKHSPLVRVQKGQTWSFPTKDRFFLSATEPVGPSHMVVIVSTQKRGFDAMQPKPEGPIQLFPTGEQATALAAQFKGPNSPLAGRAECASGAPGTDCADEYGAALMKFETRR